MGRLSEYSQEDQDRINAVPEKFNDVGPFEGCPDMCIEKDPDYSANLGKLWMGSIWFSVDEARALRDWLNKVIP